MGVKEMQTGQTLQRILKVNHAGEYGAIRIYRAQLFVARWRATGLVPFLEETLAHEIDHCRRFRNVMPHYATRPCRAMWLWSGGGFMLGFLTSLLGGDAILHCTAAVERTVHLHMQEQIAFLVPRDAALAEMIKSIQVQELEHLAYAESRCARQGILAIMIDTLVKHATEAAIWLSTWGDSTRMRREIESSHDA